MTAPVRTGSSRSKSYRHAAPYQPFLEALEDRLLPATFTVRLAADAGVDSLRWAIEQANQTPNVGGVPDSINFAIVGAGPHVITPQTQLPAITEAVVIDGYSQAGSSANSESAQTLKTNAVLRIVIDGINVPTTRGLEVQAPDCTIKGLVIHNFSGGTGITLTNAARSRVEGCFVGVDVGGTIQKANATGIMVGGAPESVIGGTVNAAKNLISGNTNIGINLPSDANVSCRVQGNLIGTDKDGTSRVPNGTGIFLAAIAFTDILIGGTTREARNLISGNGMDGIRVIGADRENPTLPANRIQGNLIGVDRTGATQLFNETNGVRLGGVKTLVGGDTREAGNVISGNREAGVRIESAAATANVLRANFIGVNQAGNAPVPNATKEQGGPFAGVYILNSSLNWIGQGHIGGVGDNVISGNKSGQVYVGGTTLDDAAANRIKGNFIGTNAQGTAAIPDGGSGIVLASALLTVIGGSQATERNVISGNGHGIWITAQSTDTFVYGNYIGLAADGIAPVGNKVDGIHIDNSPKTKIGGLTANERNVISGNGTQPPTMLDGNGITLFGADTKLTVVRDNYIGTDKNGWVKVPNKRCGIMLNGCQENTIGGDNRADRNVISGNDKDGIDARDLAKKNTIKNNYIGLDATGLFDLANGGFGINGSTQEMKRENYFGKNKVGFNALGGINLVSVEGTTIEQNEIFKNHGPGVMISGILSTGNSLYSNYIGTDATLANLPNDGLGIFVTGDASYTSIGDVLDPAFGNTIRYNLAGGVVVDDATFTGFGYNTISSHPATGVIVRNTTAGGSSQMNTTFRGNTILTNTGQGVLLSATGWNQFFANTIDGNTSDGVRIGVGGHHTYVGD